MERIWERGTAFAVLPLVAGNNQCNSAAVIQNGLNTILIKDKRCRNLCFFCMEAQSVPYGFKVYGFNYNPVSACMHYIIYRLRDSWP